MTWWQTLVVAAAPALVALGGVLIQLQLTYKSETRRIEADHTFQRQQAEDAHRRAMQERWRDQRRKAYLTLLSEIQWHLAWADSRIATTLQPGIMQEYAEPEKTKLVKALGTVDFYGSDDVRAAAWRSFEDARALVPEVRRLGPGHEQVSAVRQRVATVRQSNAAMMDLMRRDLGAHY